MNGISRWKPAVRTAANLSSRSFTTSSRAGTISSVFHNTKFAATTSPVTEDAGEQPQPGYRVGRHAVSRETWGAECAAECIGHTTSAPGLPVLSDAPPSIDGVGAVVVVGPGQLARHLAVDEQRTNLRAVRQVPIHTCHGER